MLRDRLSFLVTQAIDLLVCDERVSEELRQAVVEILDTKQPEHGDYACNIAMAAAKKVGMNPRQLAEHLQKALLKLDGEANPGIAESPTPILEAVEIAGPGFLNFRLKPTAIAAYVDEVLTLGSDLPNAQRSTLNAQQRINVEFVSVNPNGPITIGSGRGAAYGSALCNVFEAAGHKVHREYYINDGVNSEQMRQFADSVRAILRDEPVPDKGYKGDYVYEVAANLKSAPREDLATFWGTEEVKESLTEASVAFFQQASQAQMLRKQRLDLRSFGVIYDTWFSEQSLHDSGDVAKNVEAVTQAGAADEEPHRTILKMAKGGVIEDVTKEPQTDATPEEEDDLSATPTTTTTPTLWLRSTKLGDDMDRVLRRKDGRLTYIASDIAYHKDKFNRGSKADADGNTEKADKLITILGPDHHGYIQRLTAVVAATLLSDSTLNAQRSTPSVPRPNNQQPLSELEAKIYRSPEERDADQAALALAKQKLEVQIYQLVRFLKDGKPAPMRKRDGNIYALIDLINEIGEKVKPNGTKEEKQEAGRDVARFFYLMRSHDTTFDFDLDLAEKQSDENPVFYVQYAHARIASVIRKAEEAGFKQDDSANTPIPQYPNTSLLTDPRESALIKKIIDLPWEVRRAAEDYGVHRLTSFAIELARTYHHFYDACRVIQPEEPNLTRARLALCRAAQIALKATLDLIGISAPDRMERNDPALADPSTP